MIDGTPRTYLSSGEKYFEVQEETDYLGNVIAIVLVASVTILVAFCVCVYVSDYKAEQESETPVELLEQDPEIIYS